MVPEGEAPLNIAGSAYNFLPYAQPDIRQAIEWVTDSAGFPNGSDRGATQDIYLSKVSFAGPEATLDALQQTLQANREGVTLSGFTATGQEIFGPDVNYSGSISATVLDFGFRKHLHFNKVSTLDVVFRAIAPGVIGTAPSLASLRLQEGWEGDQTWDVGKAFTYEPTPAYRDGQADVGRLVGTFIQKPAEARAIISYLISSARAASITLPTFPGVTYPFGRPKGSGPFQCKVTGWEVSRKDLNRWIFKIEFSQSA